MANAGPSFSLSNGYYMNLTLSKITATDTLDGSTDLLPSPIAVLLASSVADLYLPSLICDRFASAFGLISDDSSPDLGSFTINASMHQQLRRINPLITFTLADQIEPSTSVDIVLSYKSLDVAFGNESDVGSNPFFPVQNIGSVSLGALGRRFFQEM